jgi:hypothetical protein
MRITHCSDIERQLMSKLNRTDVVLFACLFTSLLPTTGCGQNKKLLIGKWTRGFVTELGSAPGQPLISMSERNMTLYADGSLETRNGNMTNTGKWTLSGSTLTLTPLYSPEETFAIIKIDDAHLTLKAVAGGAPEEWTKVRDGS